MRVSETVWKLKNGRLEPTMKIKKNKKFTYSNFI